MSSSVLILAGVIVIGLVFLGVVLARLYKRSTKELSYVRTGMGGQVVIQNNGALVLPVLHEVIPVNMNTLRLEVTRTRQDGLITKDRIRVDVTAEFYVRVKPNAESIAMAAQTLGRKTLNPTQLGELVLGKFVDSLRAVAAEMEMEELHEKRVDFVQKVQQSVSEDLNKNGLELESVSLTGLDQTDISYLNANNAFDAEGMTKITETIEARKKTRNDIEQTNAVAIAQRNMEASQKTLEIHREQEYARLNQEREISVRRAEQSAEISKQEADKKREAEEAQIQAQRAIDLQRIDAEKQVEEQEILKAQKVQQAKIAQEKAIELANQEKQISISQKSQEESEAKRQADEARIGAVKAEEQVITARQIESAERDKAIELIEATKQAEKDAVGIKVQAQAEKEASEAIAEARRIEAEGEKDAEIARAEGKQKFYAVEAEGKEKINLAQNILSAEQIEMNIRMKLIEMMPQIIAESVKPMENIDSIKILQMNGQNGGIGGLGGATTNVNTNSGSLPDQMVQSALAYRAQAPLVDGMLKELGLDGGLDLNNMTKALGGSSNVGPVEPKPAEVEVVAPQSTEAEQIQSEPAVEN